MSIVYIIARLFGLAVASVLLGEWFTDLHDEIKHYEHKHKKRDDD